MALEIVNLRSPVSSLVRCPAPHLPADATLTETGQLMRSLNTSAVLVGPGHAAIVTERDLTRALANECPPDSRVDRIATPIPISVPASTDIVESAGLMLDQEVRHLIVELPDGSEGIISLRHVMEVLLQNAQPHRWLATLRARVAIPSSEMWPG